MALTGCFCGCRRAWYFEKCCQLQLDCMKTQQPIRMPPDDAMIKSQAQYTVRHPKSSCFSAPKRTFQLREKCTLRGSRDSRGFHTENCVFNATG